MRKRKLYLSELIRRCKNQEFEINIRNGATLLSFKTRQECEDQLSQTYYWDRQVYHWRLMTNGKQTYLLISLY